MNLDGVQRCTYCGMKIRWFYGEWYDAGDSISCPARRATRRWWQLSIRHYGHLPEVLA